MKIYLVGKDKLKLFKLKDKSEDSFLALYKYDDEHEIPITAEKIQDKWVLKSNDKVNVTNNNEIIKETVLEDYGYYFLNINHTNKNLVLFSLPSVDKEVYDLSFDNLTTITIGSKENCNIFYKDIFTQPLHSQIAKTDSGWVINSASNEARIYVNNNFVKNKLLKIGDVIFINGLKIIWMGNFIRINNPLKKTFINGLVAYENPKFDNTNYQPEEENYVVDLYDKDDYFFQALKTNNQLSDEAIEIDSPPSKQEKEDMPFILTLGPVLMMSATSLMMGFFVFQGITTGQSWLMIFPRILMMVAMIFGAVIIPRMAKRFKKKKFKEKEEKRQEKYGEYLKNKENEIKQIIHTQEQILRNNNPSAAECYQMFNTEQINNIYFWSRNTDDHDFLTLRLGLGSIPPKLQIQAPQKRFTLDEDNLFENVYSVCENAKLLHNVPVTLSISENPKSGILISDVCKRDYINNLILQVITLHSPINLKIVVFTNEENENDWEYIKYLPHCWSEDKQTRFFATNIDEIQELSSYLTKEYKERKEAKGNESSADLKPDEENYQKNDQYKKFESYYLIIDDNYKASKNTIIVDLLLKTITNYGFSYVSIGKKTKDLPKECPLFLEISDKKGNILKKNMSAKEIISFTKENLQNIDLKQVAKRLANIPIITRDGLTVLPTSISFLEMLDVSKIEQLNITSRWKTNNPETSLSAVVGVHTNGEKFKLDLHEKFHGPHGLIAGMTGSGKSEFIITYILSMIINYHPYEVQFVLIDYKGGGLAGAFENKETNVRIPHLVGTITNLDTNEMNRTLVSIQSELKRRQKKFNDVREQLGESTIDIYKYQRLYREGLIKEPMSHLFIISDEFAELKSQQPEFMQQLISTARIGRSLGVHLILATQKPSGVVNDQIWSNSKFKVCLKVQDRSDSNEMLKRPDAASLKEPGRFYLQVGFDDYFDIGQSGWAGAKYVPTDIVIKKIDDSINFVNNVGFSVKTIKETAKTDVKTDLGDQLTNVVKAIYNIGQKQNLNIPKLWLDAIPEVVYIGNLKEKYNFKSTPFYINPIIGEFDNPASQQQGLLTLDLTTKGNTLIYGATGSGKEHLLSTIICSIISSHTPDEVNFYILDYGAETLKIFNNIPHVGDIATIEELDKVYDTFEMLLDEMDRRKSLFVDYSGSYVDYCNNSGNKLPLIVVIINNYEIFAENNSKLAERVLNIYRDASKYGIIFILSVVSINGVKGRMAQYFNNKICLQIPDASEYRHLVNSPRGLAPATMFGRGIALIDGFGFEFQTASLVPKQDMVNLIRQMAEQMNKAYTTKAKNIPVIPSVVELSLIDSGEYTLDSIPIGYEISNKKVYNYNFSEFTFIPIVTHEMPFERMSFVYSVIELLSKTKDINLRVVDLIGVYSKENDIVCYKEDLDKVIVNVYNEVITTKESKIKNVYVILGIGQIRSVLGEQSAELLNKLFLEIEKTSNSHFILVDVYGSYKLLQTEQWYQSNINNLYGIWLGPNAGSQLAVNFTNLTLDDKKTEFPYMGYAVKNGKHKLIKHVIEKVEEEDEE